MIHANHYYPWALMPKEKWTSTEHSIIILQFYIGITLSTPAGSDVNDLAVMGNGKLFVGFNDMYNITIHKINSN